MHMRTILDAYPTLSLRQPRSYRICKVRLLLRMRKRYNRKAVWEAQYGSCYRDNLLWQGEQNATR